MLRVGRNSKQYMLRLPDSMHHQIKSVADANGRSMNTEIVSRLAASFGAGEVSTICAAADRLTAIVSQLESLIQIASPAGGRIRSAQDEAMEPAPATGQPPVGAGSHLFLIDTEDRSGEAA